jgi:uncharacterized protein (DUF2345 family)
MAEYNSSKDSGFPSGYDYNSAGSEMTAKNRLQTPAGFNTSAPSAALNKHQDPSSALPIGVPGTSYTPHASDQVFSTVGGHYVVMGNAPGNETVRVQSKAGAAIELSDDGSIRVVSAKGMYLSINGDNQIVLQGDYAITTNGAMKFKAGSIIFDTAEMIMNVHGDMTKYVDGDYNEEILGDRHAVTAGDQSMMIGGDYREIITGNARDQVTGDRKVETGGDFNNLIKGIYQVSSIGQMLHLTNNNSIHSTLGSYSMTSKGNASISSQALLDLTAAANVSIGSKASLSIITDVGIKVNAKAAIQMASDENFSIDSKKYVYLTGGTNIDGYAPRIDWNSNSRSAANTSSAPGVGIPAPATYPELPDKNLLLDSISDFLATDGEIDNIVSAEQIYALYSEGGESGKPPQSILNRLAEKGIEYPPVTTGSIISTVDPDNFKSNVTDTQSGWNPGVV